MFSSTDIIHERRVFITAETNDQKNLNIFIPTSLEEIAERAKSLPRSFDLKQLMDRILYQPLYIRQMRGKKYYTLEKGESVLQEKPKSMTISVYKHLYSYHHHTVSFKLVNQYREDIND